MHRAELRACGARPRAGHRRSEACAPAELGLEPTSSCAAISTAFTCSCSSRLRGGQGSKREQERARKSKRKSK
eukprot:2285461-Rhodomonas_salina.1